MKFDVVDTTNAKVGQVELADAVFAAPVRTHLFWEVVRMQLASRRAGTHSTKTIPQVAGTTKKPYRQKGTGQARHGSRVASNMRGGAVVFGPKPRDYSYRMPKKMVKASLRSALTVRASGSALKIVRGWSPDAPKTQKAKGVLEKLGVGKVLVVGKRDDENLMKSVRNLKTAKFLPVDALNVYDILYYDNLILTEDVVQKINERLDAAPSRKERAIRETAAGG
jgi:large subunit ribosomal protein L4